MRFDVRHTSTFRYTGEVLESQNEIRACPTSDAHQQVQHYRVMTDPASRSNAHVDYWGTHVDTFGIRAPHTTLTIVTEATVETRDQEVIAAAVDRASLLDPGFRDRHFEFLGHTKLTKPSKDMVEVAKSRIELAGDDVVDGILSIHRWVAKTLEYTPGATFVATTAAQAFDQRQGVCQDFAHVAVSLCRAVGIPARYVSGYLFTEDDSDGSDSDRNEVIVATHAWFEAAVPGAGWMALDPTNRQNVGHRHITIGRGRDYNDVAPFRGSYVGPEDAQVDVEVRLRRLAAAEQQQQQ